MSIAIALHILSAIVWIGGMFFALLVLRPATRKLEPADRLPLWGRVFGNFFPWVWTSIVVLLASGYWMIFSGWDGFANLPVHLHLMQGIGWLMILVFLHLWFAPYKRFKRAMTGNNLNEAARNLNQIRIIITINLFLGLLNSVIGAAGRYL
jgi:uncharacterized membrane protein